MSDTTKSVDDERTKVLSILEHIYETGYNAGDYGGSHTTPKAQVLSESLEAITQLFTKQLQEAEIQARHDELNRVSVLYNESMLKYLDHFEERYKYLRSQLTQDTKGGTDEDLLHGV